MYLCVGKVVVVDGIRNGGVVVVSARGMVRIYLVSWVSNVGDTSVVVVAVGWPSSRVETVGPLRLRLLGLAFFVRGRVCFRGLCVPFRRVAARVQV